MLAEQEALLAECKLYKGEMEPETKEVKTEQVYEAAAVVDGMPVGDASTVLGAPVARSPWSTGLFSCFGDFGEHLTSDLQVCEYPSPWSLFRSLHLVNPMAHFYRCYKQPLLAFTLVMRVGHSSFLSMKCSSHVE